MTYKFIIILLLVIQFSIIGCDSVLGIAEKNKIFRHCNDKHEALASWWLAEAYFAQKSPPDIVILGNSQLGAIKAADTYVYNKFVDITGDHRSYTIEHDLKLLLHKNWTVFVGGLPGAMMSDQLTISRALFSSSYKPKLVALMLSPQEFVDNNNPSIVASEAFSFFAKYNNLQPGPKLRSILDTAQAEAFELQATNSHYTDRVSSLTLGKPFARICPGEVVICPGDSYLFYDSTEDYRRRYAYPFNKQLSAQLQNLDILFGYLKQLHIAAIAIDLPLATANRILLPETFWKSYHQRIAEICKKNDVDYWDAQSVWNDFSLNEFCDSVHLGLRGGLKLTRAIVLGTAYKFHFPMYAYNGNFGPLVPEKEKIYFHRICSP